MAKNKKITPSVIISLVLAALFLGIFFSSKRDFKLETPNIELPARLEKPTNPMVGSVLNINRTEIKISGAEGEKVFLLNDNTKIVQQKINGKVFTDIPAKIEDIKTGQPTPVMIFYHQDKDLNNIAEKIQIQGY